MARSTHTRTNYRNEAAFRAAAVRGWYGSPTAKDAPSNAGGVWADRRWHQLTEVAGATGWPDVYWSKPEADPSTGWVEFKVVVGGTFDRVQIPWKPAQPVVLRWLAAHHVHAGMLAWVHARKAWLWLPAQKAHRWATMVQGPNGFLPWPHTWGIGTVPKPWLLPSPARLTPYAGTRFSKQVSYMVHGAFVSPKEFDREAPVALTWDAMREREEG